MAGRQVGRRNRLGSNSGRHADIRSEMGSDGQRAQVIHSPPPLNGFDSLFSDSNSTETTQTAIVQEPWPLSSDDDTQFRNLHTYGIGGNEGRCVDMSTTCEDDSMAHVTSYSDMVPDTSWPYFDSNLPRVDPSSNTAFTQEDASQPQQQQHRHNQQLWDLSRLEMQTLTLDPLKTSKPKSELELHPEWQPELEQEDDAPFSSPINNALRTSSSGIPMLQPMTSFTPTISDWVERTNTEYFPSWNEEIQYERFQYFDPKLNPWTPPQPSPDLTSPWQAVNNSYDPEYNYQCSSNPPSSRMSTATTLDVSIGTEPPNLPSSRVWKRLGQRNTTERKSPDIEDGRSPFDSQDKKIANQMEPSSDTGTLQEERSRGKQPNASTARSESRDAFLIRCKQSGMSYKEIKERGHFTEAESTLRGRFRSLTKRKELRVRKPGWGEFDVSNSSSIFEPYV
ncbi:hypothetical protein FQN57_002447 [Myotisia sp. PD_48]|nr:hypothetical protein FQN57_002447 [Myotisia sp. PD_48]